MMRSRARDALAAHFPHPLPCEAATGDRDGGRDVHERAQDEGPLVHPGVRQLETRNAHSAAAK